MDTILTEFKKRGESLKNKNIVLFRTDIAPPDLERGLKKAGARIHPVTAYKTTTPKQISADIRKRVLSGDADFAAFTSASTVDGFVRHFGKKTAQKLSRRTHFLSIGPVTTKTLKSYGLKPYRQAKTFTVEGLVETLVQNS